MSNQQTFLSRAVTRIYTNIWYSRDHDAILLVIICSLVFGLPTRTKGERR
jgi:hypothetical protein